MNINKTVPVNKILLDDGYDLPLVCDDTSDRFICRVLDYDGTVLKEELVASGETFELPSEFPTHDKLIAQEWVGPVEIVDNKVTVTDRDLLFGVTYTTKSGLSEFDIELTKASNLMIGFNMDGTKDWGDGTVNTRTTHTYASPGKYTITCNGTIVGDVSSDEWRGLFGASYDETRTFVCDARIGSNVTKIGESFYSCCGLRTITIPNTVTEIVAIDSEIFVASEEFAEVVTIPSSVTDLSKATIKAKNIILPNTIITMGSISINRPTILSLPDSLETIGRVSLPVMEKFVFPKKLSATGDFIIHSIDKLAIPNTMKSIPIISEGIKELNVSCESFSIACPNMINLTLEEGVKSILFNTDVINYGVTELKMPSTFMYITNEMLYMFKGLEKIYFNKHTQIPDYNDGNRYLFWRTMERVKIIVPDALYDAWIADERWSKLAKYIYKVSELESNTPVETTPSGKYVSTSTSTARHSVVDFTITDGVVVSVNTGESYLDRVPQDIPNLTLSGNTLTVHHIYYDGGDSVGDTTLTYDPMTDSFSGKIYLAGSMESVSEIDATFIKE